ncbi:MAG: 5-formyltetrahydrofolate cyclo-ligase [Candidatus Omnitrophica bacterium]|nr:5-formyltetrahydrofolate cyclo-ligase [Candidatus Omnitrophota bacterium]
MNIKEEKRELRFEILDKLKRQNLTERKTKSSIITQKILLSPDFKNAERVMLYAAMTYEVETRDIITHAFRMRKKVILPLLDREKREITPCEIKDFEKETQWCTYGFREPNHSFRNNIEVGKIDIVIIPGICFDTKNNRLGRGIGCYDKFLSLLKPDIITIGLGFDFQIRAKIPTEKHDVPLTEVISNN